MVFLRGYHGTPRYALTEGRSTLSVKVSLCNLFKCFCVIHPTCPASHYLQGQDTIKNKCERAVLGLVLSPQHYIRLGLAPSKLGLSESLV